MSNAVKSELIGKSREYEGRTPFSVRICDKSDRLLYIVGADYNNKTRECNCNFIPKTGNLKPEDFNGKNGMCSHYPNGNCDILMAAGFELSE